MSVLRPDGCCPSRARVASQRDCELHRLRAAHGLCPNSHRPKLQPLAHHHHHFLAYHRHSPLCTRHSPPRHALHHTRLAHVQPSPAYPERTDPTRHVLHHTRLTEVQPPLPSRTRTARTRQCGRASVRCPRSHALMPALPATCTVAPCPFCVCTCVRVCRGYYLDVRLEMPTSARDGLSPSICALSAGDAARLPPLTRDATLFDTASLAAFDAACGSSERYPGRANPTADTSRCLARES
jgi:hypothetical protein